MMTEEEREAELRRMDEFGKELDSGQHPLSQFLSRERIAAGRDRIHMAIMTATVNNGHGVWIHPRPDGEATRK